MTGLLTIEAARRFSPDLSDRDAILTTETGQQHVDSTSVRGADVFRRVTRNVGWLVISDGFRLASMTANILVARFLGAADFGIVALARESARYVALPGDLGIATYGQAEAARSPHEKLGELVDEIAPARAFIGVMLYALFAGACFWRCGDAATLMVFLACGLFIVSEALRTDWLYRGRERFDLVVAARAVETLSFLLIVLLVGSRPRAAILDSVGWSASELLMAAVWFFWLSRTIGRSVRLRVDFRGWFRHAADAIYVPIAIALVWSAWLILLWMVESTGSRHEVGILAAPYSLTMSCINMGAMLAMGFFPAAATLAQDSQMFTDLRRTLTSAMLVLSVPIAVVGTVVAEPLVRFLFGPAYRESAPLLALVIWLVPLRLIRAAYGYTLLSSGFQRFFPLGPGVGLLVTAALGIPLTIHHHALGAALAAVIAEIAGTISTIAISRFCYGDGSLPDGAWLAKFAVLNLAIGVAGPLLVDHVGWMLYFAGVAVLYPLGLVTFDLIDVRGMAAALFGAATETVTPA